MARKTTSGAALSQKSTKRTTAKASQPVTLTPEQNAELWRNAVRAGRQTLLCDWPWNVWTIDAKRLAKHIGTDIRPGRAIDLLRQMSAATNDAGTLDANGWIPLLREAFNSLSDSEQRFVAKITDVPGDGFWAVCKCHQWTSTPAEILKGETDLFCRIYGLLMWIDGDAWKVPTDQWPNVAQDFEPFRLLQPFGPGDGIPGALALYSGAANEDHAIAAWRADSLRAMIREEYRRAGAAIRDCWAKRGTGGEDPIWRFVTGVPSKEALDAAALFAFESGANQLPHKDDTTRDTKKESKKKMRRWTTQCDECLALYKNEMRPGGRRLSMKAAVTEYVEGKNALWIKSGTKRTPLSVEGIMRRFADHPDRWKTTQRRHVHDKALGES